MKKIMLFIFMVSLFLFQGCYEDFKTDFTYSATYFARQYPLRTLVDVEGQNMTFEIGAVLGGKYTNAVNEQVTYSINGDLLDPVLFPTITGLADAPADLSTLTQLPDSYYSIDNPGGITIPSGAFKGGSTVTLDKDLFLNDPLAVGRNYAIPIEMISTSADSILAGKHYSVIVLRYYNKYHGWYYVKGTDTNTLDNSVETYSENDLVLNEDMLLETTSKNELSVPYVGNPKVTGRNMVFSIADGSVTISEGNVTGTSGTGTYDANTRNFTLNYSYTDGNGDVHNVVETLTYRNTELVLEDWQ
jgi:hypothetical protein